MHWTAAPSGRLFTLTVESCKAIVQRASSGEWIALISRNRAAVGHQRFFRLQEAQAWCEAQIAELSQQ